MESLSVIILTKNEERNIPECIESALWADSIFVLDSFSEDRTVEIAREMGAKVERRLFQNYADQRNAALEMAESEWVFFLDADERITKELAEELRQVISPGGRGEGKNGWWVPRRNYIFGRWIRNAGWYPDYQMRLLRRGRARYDPTRKVHEVVLLEGQGGFLQNPLIHYNYNTLAEFLARQSLYTDYEVEILRERGFRPKPHNFILQPWREFYRRYFTLQGYKDGYYGLLLSVLLAYYEFLKHWRLWRKF